MFSYGPADNERPKELRLAHDKKVTIGEAKDWRESNFRNHVKPQPKRTLPTQSNHHDFSQQHKTNQYQNENTQKGLYQSNRYYCAQQKW